jgi:hypothetical protein
MGPAKDLGDQDQVDQVDHMVQAAQAAQGVQEDTGEVSHPVPFIPLHCLHETTPH